MLIFSLSAECGPDRTAADKFAAYYDGLIVQRGDGSAAQCEAFVFHDGEAWWATVTPDGVSKIGIRNESDRAEMTAIAFAFYERLRTAPPYRYAAVGIEVDEFRTHSELLRARAGCDFDGLVVNDETWTELGEPESFEFFAPGYRWRPFTTVS